MVPGSEYAFSLFIFLGFFGLFFFIGAVLGKSIETDTNHHVCGFMLLGVIIIGMYASAPVQIALFRWAHKVVTGG